MFVFAAYYVRCKYGRKSFVVSRHISTAEGGAVPMQRDWVIASSSPLQLWLRRYGRCCGRFRWRWVRRKSASFRAWGCGDRSRTVAGSDCQQNEGRSHESTQRRRSNDIGRSRAGRWGPPRDRRIFGHAVIAQRYPSDGAGRERRLTAR